MWYNYDHHRRIYDKMFTKCGNFSLFLFMAIHCGCNFTFLHVSKLVSKKKCDVLKIRYSGKYKKYTCLDGIIPQNWFSTEMISIMSKFWRKKCLNGHSFKPIFSNSNSILLARAQILKRSLASNIRSNSLIKKYPKERTRFVCIAYIW